MPIEFWGDYVLTATYLINRFPLSTLNHKTPFEMLFKKKPTYVHLKTFGCLAFANTPKPGRAKFEPRSHPCIFIGYPFNKKAYKLYDLVDKVYSRDVWFYETCFPFHSKSFPTDSPLPVISSDFPTAIYYPNDTKISVIPAAQDFFIAPNDHDLLVLLFLIMSLLIRRSTRISHKPAHLKDYVCYHVNTVSSQSVHSHDHCISPFIASVSLIHEPTSYKIASQDPLWVAPMTKEVKLKSDGSIERYKARLVAKGFTQKQGIDYNETFSSVVKMSTVRCILTVAAFNNWNMSQLDVNNVFLHGDLHEDVYMKPPEGIKAPTGTVCKLRKSLYGLKQAWLETSFETMHTSVGIVITVVYVDDLLVTGSDSAAIEALKVTLHKQFSIKDLGNLHYFLGFEIGKVNGSLTMSQCKFTNELIRDSGILNGEQPVKAPLSPLPLNFKLSPGEGALLEDAEYYRSMVGKLNFLTNTRPDLCYSVQTLSQFMQKPRMPHLQALHQVLAYVHHSAFQGLLLQGSYSLTLQAYSDSDWAACPTKRLSITGYLIKLGLSPISWKSKKQSTISRSSAEAEYRAMAQASAEITWLIRLLEEPVTLHCDNTSAMHIARNSVD
ncbi:transmembrane signal receptor [Lithospermum erythrorhizon]|uniref:Transmembrane signal receptor n=1 Tax=Lithospermum erythrorhizon TaxID=34254 RepID=A0AAV3Q0F7_LITER